MIVESIHADVMKAVAAKGMVVYDRGLMSRRKCSK
jgi:hypothetical protein